MNIGSSDPKALPGNLQTNRRLSQWLRFDRAGFVEVRSGKVEIGQGILTALAQIVSEELDIDLARVRMARASTARSPNEAVTSGSLSIQDSGAALRYACAEVRAIYLDAAAAQLNVSASALTVRDGDIVANSGARTSYWKLADDRLLDREATASVAPKQPHDRHVAGRSVQRLDLPDKVFGRPRFIQDLMLPGLLHGRVLRLPSPGARLQSLDENAARDASGVIAIVRDGDFVGIIAETEEASLIGLARLRSGARWSERDLLPDESRLRAWLKSQETETTLIDQRQTARGANAARTIRREVSRPFLAHAAMSPSCAIAQWGANALSVWTHSQGIYNLRADLAVVMRRPVESIVVEHVEGAGCYGHNAADDVALDAALLARASPERPVRVLWSREDEMSWAPFGAAMAVDIEADLDADGNIVDWRHAIWSNGHSSRPGRAAVPMLLAASHLAEPFPRAIAGNAPLAVGGGSERNAVPYYAFPNWEITNHRVLAMPIRTSALRSLGAFANVFAIETLIDEIAAERSEDPIAFRLRHLSDPRARAVIEAVARRSGWNEWQGGEGLGHGVGFARYKNAGAYCAVIAEIEAEHVVRVRRLVIAVDVGEAINPDGVVNQIEGGAVQATSWTLKEAVRFDRRRIISSTFETYPILSFSEAPRIDVELIQRSGERSLGAGEAAHGPVAAAIGNALFDALGIWVRALPITPERVIAAMA